eukprot:scaffold158440_cov25-Tisochrysis_lutea.AAC.1
MALHALSVFPPPPLPPLLLPPSPWPPPHSPPLPALAISRSPLLLTSAKALDQTAAPLHSEVSSVGSASAARGAVTRSGAPTGRSAGASEAQAMSVASISLSLRRRRRHTHPRLARQTPFK